MYFGSPEFVLTIIGMAMLAGVMKTAIHAKHGRPDNFQHVGGKKGRRAEIARLNDETANQVASLREQNARLSRQIEAYEDRLIVVERIVTDRGYLLASEIEALRDRQPVERKLEEKL